MSDIGLNLSGVIALFVFLFAAVSLVVSGLICLIVASVKAGNKGETTRQQGAFTYFLASLPLVGLNLIFFGILFLIVDSASREQMELADKAAAYVWLPLQVFMWIAIGMAFRKKVEHK